MRVHALVGHAKSVDRIACLGRHEHGAVRRADREAFPVLVERVGCSGGDVERVLDSLQAGDDTELVAAHAIRAGFIGQALAELLREPFEQRVTGGVSVRVVVSLEAVEIVDGQK